MAEESLELPAAFVLVRKDKGESIRGYAKQLAEENAEEGTLAWLGQQSSGIGRFGSQWESSEGDLHCAIVLRPDFPISQYADMLLVATVSMGNALAMHMSPLTALSYQWPGKLAIAGHTVGAVWVDYHVQDPPWLAVSCSINFDHAPGEFSTPAISIREAEGSTTLSSAELLVTYARQFVVTINFWSEKGQAALVEKWKIRGNRAGDKITLIHGSNNISGVVEKVLDNGDMEIRNTENHIQRVQLSDYIERA